MYQRKSDDEFLWSKQTRIIFVIFILFVGASIVEGVLLASHGLWSFAVSPIKATGFLAAIALFLFAVGLHKNDVKAKDTFLSWMGRNSYPVYLMHGLFLFVSLNTLKRFYFIYNMQPIFILVNVVIVIAACSSVILMAKVLTPAWFQKKCIGI
jgi:fucose 4-O-acetylase-like acetyltransferase